MTYREKLQQDHPEYVNEKYDGGCFYCPGVYYPEIMNGCKESDSCEACWSREYPESEGLNELLETL